MGLCRCRGIVTVRKQAGMDGLFRSHFTWSGFREWRVSSNCLPVTERFAAVGLPTGILEGDFLGAVRVILNERGNGIGLNLRILNPTSHREEKSVQKILIKSY